MTGFGRHSLFGMAVLAATGVPYALSNLGDAPSGGDAAVWSRDLAKGSSTTAADLAAEFPALRSTEQPIEGPGVSNLGEVFRFDATPSWVLGRWPRVMNSRYDDLQAYRVPLVTGSKDADLAGSLTYFFNPQQQLRQIRFQGSTGDAQPLALFVMQQHGFAHQPTKDPGEYLYQAKQSGRPIGQLRIVTVPLVEASASTMRFQVDLWLERPDTRPWFPPATGTVDSYRWQ